MNLYSWFLLKTFGWSEILLRFPSLIAGILGLVVFPLFIKKVFNTRIAIVFAFLYAISPFLIFYSRMYRPYIIVVFLSFIAICFLYFWIISKELKYAFFYVISSVLAVYYHPFAVVAVLAPLSCVFLFKFFQIKNNIIKDDRENMPSIFSLTIIATIISLLITTLLLPAYLNNLWWLHISYVSRVTLKTVINCLYLLTGTTNQFMVIVLMGLFVVGQLLLFRKNRLLSCMLLSIIIINSLLLAISRQEGIYAAIQALRYSISIFSIYFLSVALGIDYIIECCQSAKLLSNKKHQLFLTNLLTVVFLFAILFVGPLKNLYASPNNFTNHSAFQESYKPLLWEKSFAGDLCHFFKMNKERIPNFYFELSKNSEVKRIIEYPMYTGDNFNLYYYYQHFHKKKILVGYDPGSTFNKNENKDFMGGVATTNELFSSLKNPTVIKFKNFININDIEALKASHADYIILHKNIMYEMFPKFGFNDQLITESAFHAYQNYKIFFGQPVLEDHDLVVFNISSTLKR